MQIPNAKKLDLNISTRNQECTQEGLLREMCLMLQVKIDTFYKYVPWMGLIFIKTRGKLCFLMTAADRKHEGVYENYKQPPPTYTQAHSQLSTENKA